MRWHPAVLVLLICALSKWLLATDIQIQDPSLAGMPLSDVEYDHFFKTLNSPHRVSAVCFLRSMYGCQNALVQTLDLYENHGIVPEGRVCSDFAEMPSFPDFCTLTLYRCSLKKYFVKRIQCPDQISETSSTTQNIHQELENTESSFALQETPLTSILPPTHHTTRTSPPPLTSVSSTPTVATETIPTNSDTTTGTIPKHPSMISTTSTKPLLDLPTSSTPVTTDSESWLGLLTSLDAVIAEQSFPELFTTTLNMGGVSSQHLMPDVISPIPVPALSSTSNAMTATPATSVPVVTESSSEPTTPQATTPSLGSLSTNPATTVATSNTSTSASTSPVVTATKPTTPSVGSVPTNPATTVAPSSNATSASTSPVVTATASEPTTPSVGSVPTIPATTVTPSSSPTSASTSPVVTATEATTPLVGSVPTNPATTVATSSSSTSATPSPVVIVTATATSTTSSSSSPSPSSSTTLSLLLTKPAIPKGPAQVLPPARVAGWPIVPISALLGQYPLQPTSVVQLLLLPPGFGPRKSKPQAIAISSLLPFGAGPANIWQRKIMAKRPMNLPTTAKWVFLRTKTSTAARLENSLPTKSSTNAKLENFLLQLQDDRVQQLMQKMRALMSKGKAVKKQLLQSTSLQLLSALKNANKKSGTPLAAKKQLQR